MYGCGFEGCGGGGFSWGVVRRGREGGRLGFSWWQNRGQNCGGGTPWPFDGVAARGVVMGGVAIGAGAAALDGGDATMGDEAVGVRGEKAA